MIVLDASHGSLWLWWRLSIECKVCSLWGNVELQEAPPFFLEYTHAGRTRCEGSLSVQLITQMAAVLRFPSCQADVCWVGRWMRWWKREPTMNILHFEALSMRNHCQRYMLICKFVSFGFRGFQLISQYCQAKHHKNAFSLRRTSVVSCRGLRMVWSFWTFVLCCFLPTKE